MNTKISLSILFSLFVFSNLYSQVDIKLEGIGGKFGFIMPESPIDNTISISAHADLGNINKQIFLGAFVEYWTKSYDAGIAGASLADGRWTEFIIAPLAKYNFYTGTNITPYAGGGVGFAIISFNNDYTNLGVRFTESSSKLDVCLFALGGVEFPINNELKGLAEVKFHINGANFLGIYAGMTYLLP